MAKVKFKTPKENRVKRSLTPYVIVIGALLFIYAISLIFPLLWGFMTTFKSSLDWARPYSMFSLPDFSKWDIYKDMNETLVNSGMAYADSPFAYYDNIFGSYTRYFMDSTLKRVVGYRYGWNMQNVASFKIEQGFFDFCYNTFLYACVSAVLTVMAPMIMGYLCARYPGKISEFIYSFVIVVMIFPIVGTGAAVLTLTKKLSLHDTFWGLWIRELNFMNMYFLVFYAFYKSMSNTYAEAAEIDGAGQFRIMWTIYVPFAIKMMSTAFLIQFVGKYNNYSINILHLPSRLTLAYAAWMFMQESQTALPEKLATCYTLSVPMLIFFVAFKNKLMGNMTVGGLKG